MLMMSPSLHERDGAAIEGLGRHVADAGPAAGSAEAAVGDEGHTGVQARAGQGRGRGEHLGHAGAALGPHVADDHHSNRA